MGESRYNRWYKMVKGEGIFKEGMEGERWQRVARYRLGGEVKENKYWEEEEKRKCRICE